MTNSLQSTQTSGSIWLNGAFGSGKTTAAREVMSLIPGSRILDTEYLGFLLRDVLAPETVGDFQDWRPWRALVVATVTEVLAYTGGVLIIPQTVLAQRYWQEIRNGFDKVGVLMHHVVLHAGRDELVRRITCDTVETTARQWRLDHLDAYEAAGAWHRQEAHVIDTTGLRPREVAARIAAAASPAAG